MTSLLRFAAYASASLAVVAVAATAVVRATGGEGALAPVVAAGALTLLAAIVGYVPLARARLAPLEKRAQSALLGVVVRLFATLVGVVAVTSLDLVEARNVFLTWTAVDYTVLLALETWIVAGAVARAGGGASA